MPSLIRSVDIFWKTGIPGNERCGKGEVMFDDKDRKVVLWAVLVIMTGSLAMFIIAKTKESSSNKKLQAELLEKHSKRKPPPMIDPFTGNVIVKATTIKVVKRAIARGDHKVEKPVICHDFCGNGKKSCGIWTEVEALKKGQEEARRKYGAKWCLQITRSCATNAYQNKIWRRRWVYKDGKPVLKKNGDILTSIVVAPPGFSFHEACRAFDIANYAQAQQFLWKQGFVGGTRGLAGDAVHFSRGGEFTNAEFISWRHTKNQLSRIGKWGAKKTRGWWPWKK